MNDTEARLAEATRVLEWLLDDFKVYAESDDEKKMADRYSQVIIRALPLVKDGVAKLPNAKVTGAEGVRVD